MSGTLSINKDITYKPQLEVSSEILTDHMMVKI